MNFAHTVGEHQFESTTEQITHLLSSWLGMAIAVVAGLIVLTVLYIRTRKTKPVIEEKDIE